jgi:hypothetical protein
MTPTLRLSVAELTTVSRRRRPQPEHANAQGCG